MLMTSIEFHELLALKGKSESADRPYYIPIDPKRIPEVALADLAYVRLKNRSGEIIAAYRRPDGTETVKAGDRERSAMPPEHAEADLPFTMDDLVKVLGEPDQRNDESILYDSKLKATKTKDGMAIAFSTDSEGLFFVSGLFSSGLFTKAESDQIIDFIDEIGKDKVIGRFKVKLSKATEPRGWRQASISPKR
jgi:hypothetical protein